MSEWGLSREEPEALMRQRDIALYEAEGEDFFTSVFEGKRSPYPPASLTAAPLKRSWRERSCLRVCRRLSARRAAKREHR
jgi:hypothetical protein